MIPSAAIISVPTLNQNLFLSVCQTMLGYSPARSADSINLSGIPYLLAIFSSFRDKNAAPNLNDSKDILSLLNFCCLIAADDIDIPYILEVSDGMSFAITETTARGIQAVLINGSLKQWKNAIFSGCQLNKTSQVRTCYNKLYLQFCQLGLTDLFESNKKTAFDKTFYLEAK